MDKIVEFEGIPVKCLFSSENYKIYGCEVDTTKYDVKKNKHNNVSILGNFHDLAISDVKYKIKAKEDKGKYGIQYKVINITRDKPTTKEGSRLFLNEILSKRQADVLMDVYPDIIDRVMNNRLDDIDLNKTKGIKERTFNVIKTKIIENFALAELVDEFKGLLSLQVLRSLYDKYPSTTKIKEEISAEPYRCLCGLSRVGFKTADSILLKLDKIAKEMIEKGEKPPVSFDFDLLTSEFRMKASIIFLLEDNEKEGHTAMSLQNLNTQAKQLSNKCMPHFGKVLKDDTEFYINIKQRTCSLKATFDKESYIANTIKEAIKNPKIWDIENLEQYRKTKGIEATDTQLSILDVICKNSISILAGYSGSGKSQSTNMVIEMAKRNNKTFSIFAPTGKASRVSSSYTGSDASTIHRGLGYKPINKWTFNKDFKLRDDIIIIDEYSMADNDLSFRLFEAIDFTRTKVLIVGDPAQLSSVGSGNLLHDFISSRTIPIVMLDKIFRYGIGGLTTVATKMRKGEAFLNTKNKGVQTFGEDNAYAFIPSTSQNIIKNTINLYSKLMKKYKPEDIMILSPYNVGSAGSTALNQAIQPIANKNYGTSKKISIGENIFYLGDLVIQNVNNYKATKYKKGDEYKKDISFYGQEDNETFISNGDIGRIAEIKKDLNIINFEDETIQYKKEELNMVKLAYAISVHRSQGSENQIIIFISDKSHAYMLNSNIMYVATTRAKTRCFHMGNALTINKAVKKKANLQRNTNMQNLLQE